MKRAIVLGLSTFFFLFAFLGVAHAHDVDKNTILEMKLAGHPCFVDEKLAEKWFKFWHCKRNLEDLVVRAGSINGRLYSTGTVLKRNPEYISDSDVIHYFAVAPAEPITLNYYGCTDWYSDDHILACEKTTSIFEAIISAAEARAIAAEKEVENWIQTLHQENLRLKAAYADLADKYLKLLKSKRR